MSTPFGTTAPTPPGVVDVLRMRSKRLVLTPQMVASDPAPRPDRA